MLEYNARLIGFAVATFCDQLLKADSQFVYVTT